MKNKLSDMTPSSVTNVPRDNRLSEYQITKMLKTNHVRASRRKEIAISILIAMLFLGGCIMAGNGPFDLTSVDCARGGCK